MSSAIGAIIGLATVVGTGLVVYNKGYDKGHVDGYHTGYDKATLDTEQKIRSLEAEKRQLQAENEQLKKEKKKE